MAKAKTAAEVNPEVSRVTIEPLKMALAEFQIKGKTPYMQLQFSEKSRNKMMASQAAGEKAKSKKARAERDFADDYKNAKHVSTEGWHGIPATALKSAMVSACRLCGVPMTRAKLLLHVQADGYDVKSLDQLIKIEGTPEIDIRPVKNANGSTDLRVRALWKEWSAIVRVEYDSGCISVEDVLQLLYRAGRQVGIGEGRPDSKKSTGLGLGLFDVEVAGAEKAKRRAA